MTGEQWSRAFTLFKPLSSLPAREAIGLLEQSGEDLEIIEAVRQILSGSNPGMLWRTGITLGRYVVGEPLGRGGYGEVYRGQDTVLGRAVALKFLLSRARLTKPASRRLLEEAQAASALNHPNIVTVHEVIDTESGPVMVMELVEGTSLREVLRKPVPAERAQRYGVQLLEALAAAHAHGIVHRDLKPENVMVRPDGYLKVLDFGLARQQASEGELPQPAAGNAMPSGTLGYVSPEQCRGESATAASDMFAAGLVLYEMAAGQHAFEGSTPVDTARAILRSAPRAKPAGPRADVTMRLLEKNPADRPTAAQALELLRAGERRNQRWKWGLAIAAALLFSALALLPVWRSKPELAPLSLNSTPLTGQKGRESLPALSPDGRFVAYQWRATATAAPALFVREVGTDHANKLPIGAELHVDSLVWHPNGQRIGFVERGPAQETLVVISLDGTGRQTVLQTRQIHRFEWAPDGDTIVYSGGVPGKNDGPGLIFAYRIKTGERKQITFPPGNAHGDWHFAISPNGRRLAFRRVLSLVESDIYVMEMGSAAEPRRLTFDRKAGTSLVWTSDGLSLIAATGGALWQYAVDSPAPPRKLTESGMRVSTVGAALRRNRLVWVNDLDDVNIWRIPSSGQGAEERVIASTMYERDGAWSSTGRLAFRSDRSGFPEIWISGANGATQKKVTSFEAFTGSPRWSPDGRWLAFDSKEKDKAADVFLMNCNPPGELRCGAPMKVTDHKAADALPTWSNDGRSIYFASQRSGRWEVWRTPAALVPGAGLEPAMQMTAQGGYLGTESADGKWLYYSRIGSPAEFGVWRKPLTAGGLPGADPGGLVFPMAYGGAATWILSGREIFYWALPPQSRQTGVGAFDLATRRSRMVYLQDDKKPLTRGLAVSPDGKWVLIARTDLSDTNIVVADYVTSK